MSEPENFLARWSRRKQETGDKPAPAAEAVPEKPAGDGAPESNSAPAPADRAAPPAFDPASLPSLDSIGAQTDISAFLKPGVPSELRLAALRRAWSADPAIRDFKGLQENDWNFNDPNGIPGFGELGPDFDVKQMLADLFGETPRTEETPAEKPAPAVQPAPPSHELAAPAEPAAPEAPSGSARGSNSPGASPAGDESLLQRKENIASQDRHAESGDAPIKRRRSQGRALPE